MRGWLAVLVGCGGTSAASFPEDYAEATCDWLDACDQLADQYTSESACVDDLVSDLGELPEDCEFDEASAEECLSGIRENDCEADVFEGPICARGFRCGGGEGT